MSGIRSMRHGAPPDVGGLELVGRRGPGYNSGLRGDVIALLAAPLGRVLDVGCGQGGAAPLLRGRGATELVGVELDEHAARAAEREYDEVLVGSAEGRLPWAAGSFDTVLCYDVLEHLYDPWSLLAAARDLLGEEGRLHISVPNVRHWTVLLPLLLRGRFSYAPEGLLDVTHIRFFTRSEMEQALRRAGFTTVSVAVPHSSRPAARLLRRLTRDRLLAFTSSHWFMLAQPATAPSGGAL